MNERGKITFRDRALQVRDYSGLQFERNITPSDIDGAVDFDGRCFVFIELKLSGAPFPYGQRLLYERICDRMTTIQTTCAVIVAEHSTPISEEINCAAASVISIRWNGKWYTPKNHLNVRGAIEKVRQMPNPLQQPKTPPKQ